MDTGSKAEHANGIGLRLVWNESQMTTGFPEVDAQHREWIARFNEFEDAICHDKGQEACANALVFFMHYTDTHFKFEEGVMEHYRCSGKYLNQSDHDLFKAWLQELTYKTWPLGATPEDVAELEEELVNWMRNHICNVDVKLREVVPAP